MENTTTRRGPEPLTTQVPEPNRVQMVLWVLFVVAAIAFATSVLSQLGTIAGLSACLVVGVAGARLMPDRAIR